MEREDEDGGGHDLRPCLVELVARPPFSAPFVPAPSWLRRDASSSSPMPLPRWRKHCSDLLIGRMGLECILTSSPSTTPAPPSAPPPPTAMGEGCHFCVRFSPDGARVATAAAECIEIWQTGSRGPPRLQHRLDQGHSEIVTHLVWSHSRGSGEGSAEQVVGDFFSCSLDKTIKLWRDCRVVHSFDDHKGAFHTPHTHTPHTPHTRALMENRLATQLGAHGGRRDAALWLRIVDHLRVGRGHRSGPLHAPRRPLLRRTPHLTWPRMFFSCITWRVVCGVSCMSCVVLSGLHGAQHNQQPPVHERRCQPLLLGRS
jgi:hypothetical protein